MNVLICKAIWKPKNEIDESLQLMDRIGFNPFILLQGYRQGPFSQPSPPYWRQGWVPACYRTPTPKYNHPTFACGPTEENNNYLSGSEYDIDFEGLEAFITKNKIDLVWTQTYPEHITLGHDGMSGHISPISYIRFRNMTTKHKLPILFYGPSLIGGDLKQISGTGISSVHTIRHTDLPDFPILDQKSNVELNEWIESYELKHKVYDTSRQQICETLRIPQDKKLMFCPLQSKHDINVTMMSPWMGGNLGFMHRLDSDANLKDFVIIYKKCANDCEPILNSEHILPFDHGFSAEQLLRHCDCAVGINSEYCCQALLFNKPVVTFGVSFYDRLTICGYDKIWVERLNSIIQGQHKKELQEKTRRFLHHLIFSCSFSVEDDPDNIKDKIIGKHRY